MQLPRRGFLLVSALALAALSSRAARASVARALTLAELVRSSDRALIATPLAAQSRWETVGGKRRIVTDTRVRVHDVLGGPQGEPELVVRTLGGQVGDVGQVVHGEALLLIGEPALLLLAFDVDGQLHPTAMAQGHYPIRTAPDGQKRLAPSPRGAELVGDAEPAAKRLVGKTLADGSALVRKAWRDAR